ncbi:hypothetical protein K470DRAFT_260423 [Piedraia hortae CBS 480.64]|uniref:C2H2-type domain-containing protein n=1 Tax=Piedraia hortae CBS 480.64 TaxID=1314780 RepID=A0A6A7BRG2_9PEZI|nr:hypothetical protein K470DRAFT_260423 [Piedraia hortae CBS 480.64]
MAESSDISDLSEPPSDSEHEHDGHLMVPKPRDGHAPPAKKRKTGPSSLAFSVERPPSSQPADEGDAPTEDGWSDGPDEANAPDEWALRDEAQTRCLWRDCPFGEADNNDELVKHVQSTHCAANGVKKAKFLCEWGECQKKNAVHPSGYALKAHMRSHTKEKPYYCDLPECDRSFTRSDALSKHMRTVHEPEQPRGGAASPPKKGAKLQLKNSVPDAALGPTEDEDGNPVTPSPANDNITYVPARHPVTQQAGFMIHYPPDIKFEPRESNLPAHILLQVLERQLHYAQTEHERLKQQIDLLEHEKRQEWLEKEILLDAMISQQTKDEEVPKKAQKCRIKPPRPPPVSPPRVASSPPEPTKGMAVDGEMDPYDNLVDAQMATFERLRAERELAKKKEMAQGN